MSTGEVKLTSFPYQFDPEQNQAWEHWLHTCRPNLDAMLAMLNKTNKLDVQLRILTCVLAPNVLLMPIDRIYTDVSVITLDQREATADCFPPALYPQIVDILAYYRQTLTDTYNNVPGGRSFSISGCRRDFNSVICKLLGVMPAELGRRLCDVIYLPELGNARECNNTHILIECLQNEKLAVNWKLRLDRRQRAMLDSNNIVSNLKAYAGQVVCAYQRTRRYPLALLSEQLEYLLGFPDSLLLWLNLNVTCRMLEQMEVDTRLHDLRKRLTTVVLDGNIPRFYLSSNHEELVAAHTFLAMARSLEADTTGLVQRIATFEKRLQEREAAEMAQTKADEAARTAAQAAILE